ncbi:MULTISPECIES: methylenetetrahydrofolate reductase [NAD(P)H] [Fusobacterium]|jgi:methylenetetrahydrofolate reductase (NADPH)|uniref:Methylenetetrahydrofolate reductase n=1 Tax=Fusobacterium mortiferum TaxID=850 RepID=A0A414Q2G8_FUSMR|nr:MULTISPECIES: methylenetetrahydrofolate reductase [NAD(P)H] [Fusobacterium]MCF2627866.1 methylenetetrahydrofolate reductase [NAD(P)H] [Fusobacterium mortiferum]MCF2698070.1 methylenetetrahydrofolate reductase [NAD(P)H] [Fusobacterium mortiferum]MDD7261032.1 methylenetetrahydrofolate reductase [NAD(P)H] [Fusobacterium mortiferum]MDY2801971.1 methylenetetrahydrofolate reductase [NAD(P)H] [Fusobacterium mortiferum]MDY4801334.1 methylenetetrahydrofolate reductase [NAD(P)H] [Fusobacterium mortif
MKIKELFKQKQPTISFEVFPPNKIYTLEKVYEVIDELSLLKPDFMSVTYGAGGSTRRNTVDIASKIKNINNIEALAHLTCIGATKKEIDEILKDLNKNNIENIMALRGDIPQECENKIGEFSHANDLIKYIKEYGDFSIGGAFYPEGHQETNDLLDLFNLKTKVDSGTDFLISQIFFENEKFYEFKEKLGKLNIKTPLIAGVMPITNGKQIRRITSMCGCSIPEKLKKILDRYEDNPIAMREAGIAYAMEQIIELISDDIAGIHIYTMNRVEASKKIMENIGNILRKRDENYGY